MHFQQFSKIWDNAETQIHLRYTRIMPKVHNCARRQTRHFGIKYTQKGHFIFYLISIISVDDCETNSRASWLYYSCGKMHCYEKTLGIL